MSSEVDWSPLLFEDDPTPGHPEEVDTLAHQLRWAAGHLEAQTVALERIHSRVGEPAWSGMAAQVFAGRVLTVVDQHRTAASKHRAGAIAAAQWSQALEGAHAQSRVALRVAVHALKEIEEGHELLAELSAAFLGSEAAAKALKRTFAMYQGLTPPLGVTVPTASQLAAAEREVRAAEKALDPVRRQIETAEQRLAEARAQGRRAQEQHARGEWAFREGMEAAATGAPRFEPSKRGEFATALSKLTAADLSGGAGVLTALERLTTEQWAALVIENPQLAWKALDDPPSPDEVATWWGRVKDSPGLAALLKKAPELFGNLDGIPFGVRDACNRAVLKKALKDPASVYEAMDPRHQPGSLDEFIGEAKALDAALKDADSYKHRISGGRENQVVQLVHFGARNGAVTAAVSLGDLDRATNVTVNVPGAGSKLAGGLAPHLRAGRDLARAASKENSNSTYAMVSWFGYRAPAPSEVGAPNRGMDGAKPLAIYLDGLHAGRPGNEPARVNVTGHSYGSTTASYALKLTKYPTSTFTSLGSVGFGTGTSVADLNVGHVFATESNDPIAGFGRTITFTSRTDPRDIDGVTVFPSVGVPGARDVTGHDLHPEVGKGKDVRPDPDRVGYLSPKSAAQVGTAKIVANGSTE
ncbi:alpha/beta hydrolase [Leifsonia sp. NPDC077715]|uniref:alpha/beta hydrolase n=1 Tax=Leifsonia sp. NPDC077715 TaxID=3155539 RepID=UPI003435437E